MKKAKNVKIISIDLFRTIVNIDQTPDIIWRMFLRDNFPEDLSGKYHQVASEIMDRHWDLAGTDDKHFKTIRTILEDVMAELFTKINLNSDPKLAANDLMKVHNLQKIFEDAKPFLKKLGQRYTICLATDCDLEMIEKVAEIYHFDTMFVSETLQMYKLNPGFFRYIIDYYNLPPANILHIGDSKSDILNPKQLGIRTCWLNRRNLKWDQIIKPDYEVKSLLEIPDILD
jgi:FMN hydrolase / 5-amino-6-(5-phospho-D-ribitylamino)uracil phosphatase